MQIDKWYHLYGRKDNIVLEEVPKPEPKTGRWNCSDDMYESAVCSICGWDTTEPWDHIRHWFNYCPNCGARMKEGEADGKEET